MNDSQKNEINKLRMKGATYAEISQRLSLSLNTVKSYCYRTSFTTISNCKTQKCKQCGKDLEHKPKCKPKTFCSDKCRLAWWLEHHDKPEKTKYTLICECCGKSFVSNGNKTRKYCSHQCYITSRFGKSGDVNE